MRKSGNCGDEGWFAVTVASATPAPADGATLPADVAGLDIGRLTA